MILLTAFVFVGCDSSTGAGDGDETEESAPEETDTRTPDTSQPNTGKGGGSPGGGTPAAVKYAITMQDDGNGTATATPASAAAGATVTVSSMPKTGFAFDKWVSADVALFSPDDAISPASFTMPAKAVTVKAEFAALPPGTPSLSLTPVSLTVTYAPGHAPAAQTVTINNTGTDTAVVSSITLGTGVSFTLGGTLTPTIPAGGSATITVQPISNLNAGTYTDSIDIIYSGGVVASATDSGVVDLTVDKATPIVTWPSGMTAMEGQTLSDVAIPSNGSGAPAGTFDWEPPPAILSAPPGTGRTTWFLRRATPTTMP